MVQQISKIAGISYVLAWIIGLSSGLPSIALNANAQQITRVYAAHYHSAIFQFVVAEGITGLLLALVVFSVVSTMHTDNASLRLFRLCGLLAALISLSMAIIGVLVVHGATHNTDPQHLLSSYQMLNRLDGPKMVLFAVMAACGVSMLSAVPRWFRYTGYALAVTLLFSAVAYGFLLQGIAWSAYLSGVLLLVWVGSVGFIAVRQKSAVVAS